MVLDIERKRFLQIESKHNKATIFSKHDGAKNENLRPKKW